MRCTFTLQLEWTCGDRVRIKTYYLDNPLKVLKVFLAFSCEVYTVLFMRQSEARPFLRRSKNWRPPPTPAAFICRLQRLSSFSLFSPLSSPFPSIIAFLQPCTLLFKKKGGGGRRDSKNGVSSPLSGTYVPPFLAPVESHSSGQRGESPQLLWIPDLQFCWNSLW